MVPLKPVTHKKKPQTGSNADKPKAKPQTKIPAVPAAPVTPATPAAPVAGPTGVPQDQAATG
ncbi:MAG: energy transducer TonB, partial [Planctomycetota bacterium]|nr:energy transducer TonB [Planctomycetota bacterium]